MHHHHHIHTYTHISICRSVRTCMTHTHTHTDISHDTHMHTHANKEGGRRGEIGEGARERRMSVGEEGGECQEGASIKREGSSGR